MRSHPEYALEEVSAEDWTVIKQVGSILRPFLPLSEYTEGEKYATVPDYLGRFWMVAYDVFYKITDDANLQLSVKQIKSEMRIDFGRRLHAAKNDMTLAGLALHPT